MFFISPSEQNTNNLHQSVNQLLQSKYPPFLGKITKNKTKTPIKLKHAHILQIDILILYLIHSFACTDCSVKSQACKMTQLVNSLTHTHKHTHTHIHTSEPLKTSSDGQPLGMLTFARINKAIKDTHTHNVVVQ